MTAMPHPSEPAMLPAPRRPDRRAWGDGARARARWLVVAALAAACWPLATRADDGEAGRLPRWSGRDRPVVALVLSGGGARGAAHIGVLRVIEALRVPVDIVVGTSAGSIVGGAYATGMPLKKIEAEMRQLNTAVLVRDRVREAVPVERKADDEINYVGPEFGLRDGRLVLPRGAVSGVALEGVLRRLAIRQRDTDFDHFPIRYRAVATDASSAEMVVLADGSLATAMRASMAIPAVVNPVPWRGRLLVDGGASRNLPVDVARALGADVVIAVDISTPLREPGQLGSLVDMVDQMARMLTANNLKRSLAELGDADVLIQPDMGAMSSADFDHLDQAAAVGEAAGWRARDLLARYSVDATTYAALAARREDVRPLTGGDRLDAVEINGAQRVNEPAVRAAMTTRAGDPFDPARVEADMRRLFGRGDFEHVSYVLSQVPGQGQTLHTELVEKSWGPQYLRLGLGLSSDFEGNAFFSLFAAHRWTWLNRWGGEWRNQVTLGHVDRLRTEWFQPLGAAQRLFVAGRLSVDREPFDAYDGKLRVATFRRQQQQAALEAGLPWGENAELRLGVVRGRIKLLADTSPVPGSEVLPEAQTGGLVLRARWDSLDNLRFPRAGSLLDAQLYAARPALGAEDSYRKLSLTGKAAVARGPHSLQWGVQASERLGAKGPLPEYELVSLGGFLQLSGYRTGELVGSTMRFSRLVYNYRIAGPGVFDGSYVGASLEAGRIGDVLRKSAGARTLYGSALYVAVDTPLGPVYLGYGYAGSGHQAVYVFLGQP